MPSACDAGGREERLTPGVLYVASAFFLAHGAGDPDADPGTASPNGKNGRTKMRPS